MLVQGHGAAQGGQPLDERCCMGRSPQDPMGHEPRVPVYPRFLLPLGFCQKPGPWPARTFPPSMSLCVARPANTERLAGRQWSRYACCWVPYESNPKFRPCQPREPPRTGPLSRSTPPCLPRVMLTVVFHGDVSCIQVASTFCTLGQRECHGLGAEEVVRPTLRKVP